MKLEKWYPRPAKKHVSMWTSVEFFPFRKQTCGLNSARVTWRYWIETMRQAKELHYPADRRVVVIRGMREENVMKPNRPRDVSSVDKKILSVGDS